MGSTHQLAADRLVQLYNTPEKLLDILPAAVGGDSAEMATLALQRLAKREPLQARTLYSGSSALSTDDGTGAGCGGQHCPTTDAGSQW